MNNQIIADVILVISTVFLIISGILLFKTKEFKSLKDAIKPPSKKEKGFKTALEIQSESRNAYPSFIVFAGQQIEKNHYQLIGATSLNSNLPDYTYFEQYLKKFEQAEFFPLIDDEFSVGKSAPVVRRQSIVLECPV